MAEVTPGDCLILNVDDYVPGRYARTRLLQQVGYRVLEASTGQETLDAIELEKPDLVLLDVNLPDMSGVDVCKRLRSDPRTKTLTIVHISASSVLAGQQVNALNSGADGYLVEPIDPALLLATVNAYIRARRAEEEMRRLNEELHWFSFRVSHDLNEPLRTITSYAQLLKRRVGANIDPDARVSIDFIEEGAAKMRTFIDGLLQYSQAAAGSNEARPIDCESMLRKVTGDLTSSIHDSGAQITHDPLPVVAGTSQLEYVFQNLLSNAIKYRKPDKPPIIHISARQEEGSWLFSVTDNGIGIDPKYRERIFEIFQRLHGSEIPGAGIGLAMVRRIVRAHGGRIWVESSEGGGSTFFLKLPVEPVNQGNAAAV